MSSSASNVTVTVKFSQAYVSNYATLTDAVTVLFIAAYKGYVIFIILFNYFEIFFTVL